MQAARSSLDIKRKPKYDYRPSWKQEFREVTAKDTAYGKPNRALTPIKALINNNAGNEAEKYFENRQEEHFKLVSEGDHNRFLCRGKQQRVF